MLLFATSVGKEKGIEIEVNKNPWSWFNIHVELTRETDHAGFTFELCLFMRELSFRFYDLRHWDYENNCWQDNANDN